MTYNEMLTVEPDKLVAVHREACEAMNRKAALRQASGMQYWIKQLDMVCFVARRRGIRLVKVAR